MGSPRLPLHPNTYQMMKQMEQAKAALQAAEEYLIADDVSVARLHLDRALAALSTIEGSGEPVALSALMEAVAEGMNTADDRNDEPMSWIQSCLQRIKGVSDMTDAERLPILKLKPSPSLSVDEVEQVVKEWCFNWCERVTPDQSDWADLRERLTKAITRS